MAAKEAVLEIFLTLGMDISNPTSVQGQFAFSSQSSLRPRHARNVIIADVLGAIVSGRVYAFWTGSKVNAAAPASIGSAPTRQISDCAFGNKWQFGMFVFVGKRGELILPAAHSSIGERKTGREFLVPGFSPSEKERNTMKKFLLSGAVVALAATKCSSGLDAGGDRQSHCSGRHAASICVWITDLMVDKMADRNGLKLIGLAFAIVTFAVTATTAAIVANVDPDRLSVQSTAVAR